MCNDREQNKCNWRGMDFMSLKEWYKMEKSHSVLKVVEIDGKKYYS